MWNAFNSLGSFPLKLCKLWQHGEVLNATDIQAD